MEKQLLDLRTKNNEDLKFFTKIPFVDLERTYITLCHALNSKYGVETSQTHAEDVIYNNIKKVCRLEVIRSMWIGNLNIDMFIPSIKSEADGDSNLTKRVFRGLALEIDGDIHNTQFKMKKDQHKYKALDSMSICLFVIENTDINHIVVKNMINNLNTLKRLDTRARKRLLRNIYIHTILSHKDLIKTSTFPRGKYILNLLGEF